MSDYMVAERELNLAELAYTQIRRMILEKELPSGMSVVEGRLADHLDISRTPVREALMRLAAEDLLVKQGSRSFAVRNVSATEFFQGIHIREILESEAISLSFNRLDRNTLENLRREVIELGETPEQTAAQWQLDDRLHLMFPRVSGNTVLLRTICELRTLTRLCEVTYPLGRVPASTREHLAILDALLDGDNNGAREAMVMHLRNVATDCMDILRGG
ncbi:transcriptional regulator GntR [Gluconobacter thailandicus F149-1 = NBRC 100600]|uniref:GntR family transcriptional regulator n=1 Tax=Gluconobacter thailandicus NBRC 3257 TaxID=1381097 RepID=A0ABQ0J0N2_GLUTH|nr:GntR family transcriptional regulator [Gluconobacter thailandicus]GAC89346.1 GntR family transcriptional regulator [Gluconobacter thailandicus NBRC 3255]GAD28011.1 GntR family transcriptional regulator [Gluconobacter thailandicus NBRC 3257]GAN94747.1 transcriptional regulator GntR [Gluconobacter thailandicus F149-1 = NBRC 100600]GBR58916.1 GntR family transcriptional regulator [Gluconobacter thailandicus F149-1 = NBRC 100600]GEL88524.1 GntR family transcriptional regulator [Gluconobacter th